ncbi:MAG: winged helix-turn-helix transcriptional regulator [Deltaproteobacteria bacterium]|nr:winged helix-turn-helix transcriptional regulator [Deltaproteobacteria bacterium]
MTPVDTVDTMFEALADPNRRHVVDLLRAGPRRAGDLADELGMSRPAMSRHLRVLRESGLVETDGGATPDDARVRTYRLRREPFSALRRWLEDVERFWTLELGAFADYAERTRARKR